MGALAEREKKAQPKPHHKCVVLKALEQLDQEDGDAMLRLIYKRLDLTSTQVVDLLAPEVRTSDSIVRRHRQNQCEACRKG